MLGAIAQTRVIGGGGTTVIGGGGDGWTAFIGGSTLTIATPANSTPYYINYQTGALPSPPAVGSGHWSPTAPFNCTAFYVRYYALRTGTADTTANNVQLNLYDVTTSTLFADSQAFVALNGSTLPFIAPISGLSDAIAQGDLIVVRALMPATWGTQPTNVAFSAQFTCR
jgi:hypothetical protein